jgi:hypothetical protein
MNLSHSKQVEIDRLQWADQALGRLSVLQDLEAIEVSVPVRESCPVSILTASLLVSLGSVAGFFITLQL